jgi:hypothetical protein
MKMGHFRKLPGLFVREFPVFGPGLPVLLEPSESLWLAELGCAWVYLCTLFEFSARNIWSLYLMKMGHFRIKDRTWGKKDRGISESDPFLHRNG